METIQCKHPACLTVLKPDNKSGHCLIHRYGARGRAYTNRKGKNINPIPQNHEDLLSEAFDAMQKNADRVLEEY